MSQLQTPPPSIQSLPTYSADENKEWSFSTKTDELLTNDSMDENRQQGWIRMYDICNNKKMLLDMGFQTLDAYRTQLQKEHKNSRYSKTSFQRYRHEGEIYKSLFVAGIAFRDMPQQQNTALTLYQCWNEGKKEEYNISVVDLWKTALDLGGSSRRTYIDEVDKAYQQLTNGTLTLPEATAAEIQNLKDAMEKLKEEKEAAEKNAKEEKKASEKKAKDDLEAMEKKAKDDLEAMEKKLQESKKRELPADIPGHISKLEKHIEMLEKTNAKQESMEEECKRVMGYVAGFNMNLDNNDGKDTYVRFSDDEVEQYEFSCRFIVEEAFKDIQFNNEAVMKAVMESMIRNFTPYLMCREKIAEMFLKTDSIYTDSFMSEDKRIELLSKLNDKAIVEEDVDSDVD